MDIEQVTVQLGETDYTVRTIPYGRSKGWKKQVLGDIKPLFDEVADAQGMTFETPADLLGLWPMVEKLLLDGIDSVFEALIAYSPVLEEARADIENTATEKQILAGFVEVLRISDPFGLYQRLGSKIGPAMNGTPSSLDLPSGDSIETRQQA